MNVKAIIISSVLLGSSITAGTVSAAGELVSPGFASWYGWVHSSNDLLYGNNANTQYQTQYTGNYTNDNSNDYDEDYTDELQEILDLTQEALDLVEEMNDCGCGD
ncbi:MAG: hypothetical protein R3E95_19395 [Thiolinea sp.]